jgi:5-carboxymethyl-2-hydroxymuconate isomerase
MLQKAIRTIRTLLPPVGSVTPEEIDEAVGTALSLPFYSQLDRDQVIREVQSIYNIRIDDFRIIESYERRHPWINETKSSISWKFWNRYRDHLEVEKNFSPDVLGSLDRLTDRILDGLFNPNQNVIIDKRGLVVGQVQSGKTANYTGLICKAADSGYKLIIVLAGIHNNLRSQTQLRIDEGFLGFDTQHQRAFNQDNIWIGVGRSAANRDIVAHSLTSSLDRGDFNAGVANGLGLNFNTSEPIIAVVKKNVSVLRRLKSWLSTQTIELPDGRKVIRNKSLLLIDDEADNASINTNPDADKSTRINGLVRDILRMFDKSGYVGYTATPFANIFIPITEDDLFPRDFIINLPAPTNYIGPTRVFGTQLIEDEEESDTVLPVVHRINDYQSAFPNGHKKDDPLPASLPDSLKLAIKCFILTCAVRRLRGHNKTHNSMLIHVSRFILWQGGVKTLVENVFDFYRRGIELNIPSIIEELRLAFCVDSDDYKSFVTTSQQILDSPLQSIDSQIQIHQWEDVIPHLNDAASRIMVREIHGGSADVLNYYDHQDGLSVIAIGGNKLSRGLTLEGLSVSYYLRASRMYDTLMQMGRWFGYRPGYVDLCRMFTSQELNEWFCHITLASEELREEFDYMADVAGSTPEKYALRVRTHPGVLQISASNKIRRAVNVEISWAGRLVESYEFQKRPEIINSNLLAVDNFIRLLPSTPTETKSKNYLWFDVSADHIRSLFQQIQLSESLKAADPAYLLRFIDAQLRNGELTLWRVAVMSKSKTVIRHSIDRIENSLNVGCYVRNQDPLINGNNYYLRKSHIISPMDEVIDLTADELKRAKERTEDLWKSKGKTGLPSYPSGEIVRNEIRSPQNPLLIIYYLDPSGANLPVNSDPIVGYAISFPASKFNSAVSYAVHEQLLPIFNINDDEDLEDNIDDED